MKYNLLFSISVIVVLSSTSLFAQKNAEDKIVLEKNISNNSEIVLNPKLSSSVSSSNSITPLFSLGGKEFEDPEKNFVYPTIPYSAGDINGDGLTDIMYSVLTANETTERLEDRVYKSEFFFGDVNGFQKENSTGIVRNNFNPVADLNGDGRYEGVLRKDGDIYVEEIDSNGNVVQTIDLGITDFGFVTVIESHGDFNGDGFDDIIIYGYNPPNSNGAKFYLVYGTGSIEDVYAETFTYTPEGAASQVYSDDRFVYFNLENEETPKIVNVSLLDGNPEGEGRITVYELNDEEGLQQISQNVIEEMDGRRNRIGLADINNDGVKELLMVYNSGDVYPEFHVYEYNKEGDSNFTKMANRFFVEYAYDFHVIGDYNGDGYTDILLEINNQLKLVTGEETPDNFIVWNLEFEENQFVEVVNYSISVRNTNSRIDVNGDTYNDMIFRIYDRETEEVSYRTYQGNKDVDFNTFFEMVFEPQGQMNDRLYYTFNAGDLNGDGIEDFGLVYAYSTEIYFGGNNISDPDLIIPAPANAYFGEGAPAIGDFNNDGYADIVINVEGEYVFQNKQGLYFYYGGEEMDNNADHKLLFNELFPELVGGYYDNDVKKGFPAVANIRDINGDEIDDLIFSESVYPFEDSYIIFGGAPISDTPDLNFPIHGTNYVKLGDINADGVKEFAIWSYMGRSEKIFIHSGFTETQNMEEFYTPEISINAIGLDEAGTNILGLGVNLDTGDFDGDGYNDIVASPLRHINSDNSKANGIYIYRGEPELDAHIDHSFPLKNSYLANSTNQDGDVNLTQSMGEITTIPDMNSDGTEEILFGTVPGENQRTTNAVIYYGNSDISEIGSGGEPDIILEAPNQLLGLSSNNNNNLSQNAHSAVGDFNNNGKINVILPQPDDFNFFRSKSYFYELDMAVSNEEIVTEVREFSLSQNFPNPFNPTTNIQFTIPQASEVTLKVYNILGQEVMTLMNEFKQAGTHTAIFDASNVSSGMYIYRLESGSFQVNRKMMLIK